MGIYRLDNPSLNAAKLFRIQTLPPDWLQANISCGFKKGNRHTLENYRPISLSLTSVPCKILEHTICHHIISHCKPTVLLPT